MALALLQVVLLAKDQLVVVSAARAGGREAAITTDEDAIREAVLRAATTLDAEAIALMVHREGGAGEPVVVTVRYAASAVMPLVAWLFPSPIELEATSTFRQEIG